MGLKIAQRVTVAQFFPSSCAAESFKRGGCLRLSLSNSKARNGRASVKMGDCSLIVLTSSGHSMQMVFLCMWRHGHEKLHAIYHNPWRRGKWQNAALMNQNSAACTAQRQQHCHLLLHLDRIFSFTFVSALDLLLLGSCGYTHLELAQFYATMLAI
jgi:hypothetical protein